MSRPNRTLQADIFVTFLLLTGIYALSVFLVLIAHVSLRQSLIVSSILFRSLVASPFVAWALDIWCQRCGKSAPSIDPGRPRPSVVIIGSGFGALGLAVKLKKMGLNFTILEKAPAVGGTWFYNTYPGSACDVPVIHYQFSWAMNWNWSRKWAPHNEILAYINRLYDEHELRKHIVLETEVVGATFDDILKRWSVRTRQKDGRPGRTWTAEYLVSAVGQLSVPHTPTTPGLETFKGETWHAARWNHSVDLRGKAVALVGAAASAIQIVPHLAEVAGKLIIFQRTPSYIVEKKDFEYPAWEKAVFRHVPLAMRFVKWTQWLQGELLFAQFAYKGDRNKNGRAMILEYINDVVPEGKLKDALTPSYDVLCKRILLSSTYYPAVMQPHVTVVPHHVREVAGDTVVAGDGTKHKADVLIFATGFQTTKFLTPLSIIGKGGKDLRETWGDSPRAYMGIMFPDFPNFFMLYGPNTNLGHNSIIYMLECQVNWVVQVLAHVVNRGLKCVDVKESVMAEWQRTTVEKLNKLTFTSDCNSWYRTESGTVPNNCATNTISYWWQTYRPSLAAFNFK